MYKHFLRPILFLFSPESIHRFVSLMLRIVCFVPGGHAVLRSAFSVKDAALQRTVLGIKFPNPIGLAAGFDKNGNMVREMSALGFGFVEVGTVTPKAQPGNSKPRSFRLKKDNALINRMGFNNKGVDNMVGNLRALRSKKDNFVIGVNLGKNTSTTNEDAPSDYIKLFKGLYDYGDYFVINVSCPNVKCLTDLQNRDNIMGILNPLFEYRAQQTLYRPILLKISPDLTDAQVDEMVDIMMESVLDGMVATNTTISRKGLKTPPEEVEAIGNGGLSGAPLTNRAVEIVKRAHERSQGRYPIIGVGGIMSVQDAERMMEAGASLVQVYTGFIYNGPGFVKKISKRFLETGM